MAHLIYFIIIISLAKTEMIKRRGKSDFILRWTTKLIDVWNHLTTRINLLKLCLHTHKINSRWRRPPKWGGGRRVSRRRPPAQVMVEKAATSERSCWRKTWYMSVGGKSRWWLLNIYLYYNIICLFINLESLFSWELYILR